jgi:hypothetical protein
VIVGTKKARPLIQRQAPTGVRFQNRSQHYLTVINLVTVGDPANNPQALQNIGLDLMNNIFEGNFLHCVKRMGLNYLCGIQGFLANLAIFRSVGFSFNFCAAGMYVCYISFPTLYYFLNVFFSG